MADIVRLQDRKPKKPPVSRRPAAGGGKVLIFTGIRYERGEVAMANGATLNRR